MTDALLLQASAHAIPLADESVQCVVTSPPYWGLRSYAGEQRLVWGGEPQHEHVWGDERRKKSSADTGGGIAGTPRPGNEYDASLGQFCACGAWYGALGLEPTPELFVEHMVQVFREVKRVLRRDGTLWLNLGDSYSGGGGFSPDAPSNKAGSVSASSNQRAALYKGRTPAHGLKPKDLVGIPWRVAFALQADGWYLRSDIIWAKPNPMPESVTDRPTKAHEYLFLLSKQERYFYDADAIREITGNEASLAEYEARDVIPSGATGALSLAQGVNAGFGAKRESFTHPSGRNKRTVWTIPTRPYPGAHFATFPEDLVEPCILAGSSPKACGVCGAPWARVTEDQPDTRRTYKTEGMGAYANGAGRNDGKGLNKVLREDGRGGDLATKQRATIGWRSTCAHEDDSGSCLVLDPFNGSGTTGRVAIRHGRSYVGLDISREYLAQQATKRLDNIQMEAAL